MVLAAVGFAAVLAGCGGTSSTSTSASSTAGLYSGGTSGGAPKHGGNLVFARALDPQTLDPITPSGNVDLDTTFQIFDQLAEYMPGHQEPVPALATSWDVSKDALTYRFHLRPGVRFSNGRPVTAADVVFSLKRFISPTNIGDPVTSSSWQSVTAVSPDVVEVKLKKPVSTLMEFLATAEASIVPKDVFEAEGARKFASNPIGSGAFKLQSFTPGKSLRLVRNPLYWRAGQPYLDSVTFKPVSDSNARILSVRSGQANVADEVPNSQVKSLQQASGVKMLTEPLSAAAVLWVNHTKTPLSDIAVVRALSYATPRSAIIQSVFRGLAEPATTVWAKGKYWDPSIKQYPYDLATAKQLLRRTSVPNGFTVHILIGGGDQDSRLVASILQSSWGQIGVKVSIDQVDSGTLFTRLSTGDYQLCLPGLDVLTSDIPSPDELAGYVDIGFIHAGFSWFNNRTATSLYRQAVGSKSEAERRDLYRRLQRLIVENPSHIELAYPVSRTLVSANVRNFNTLPSSSYRLEQVYLGSS